jgi:hypothetical protein
LHESSPNPFTAAIGHLRTAWAALVDAERTTHATRTRQTIRQVKNLLRRLPAAGNAGKAGYPALWRQAALAVELCQRAAEITGPELPGSYRPGSQAGSAPRR